MLGTLFPSSEAVAHSGRARWAVSWEVIGQKREGCLAGSTGAETVGGNHEGWAAEVAGTNRGAGRQGCSYPSSNLEPKDWNGLVGRQRQIIYDTPSPQNNKQTGIA